jgi:hypothetical protein
MFAGATTGCGLSFDRAPAGRGLLPWQSAADPAPSMSDSLDCRAQARRQARAQYPAPRARGGLQQPLPPSDEQDRSAAENRYFDD